MKTSFTKFFAAASVSLFATFAHATWDYSVSQDQTQLLASSGSFAADGDLRFASQMISTDRPDANGFLYVENIAQYSCQKNAYQLVKAVGYKSWDDQGANIDHALGKWMPVKLGSPEQTMLNKLCNLSVADASNVIKN
jgi:hypothetical protein